MEGTPFGQYRLVELLGRGGMGEVWRAYDTVIDRVVAVKILPAHFSQDSVFQQRFRREARAAARLNNPHVIPIHTTGEIDGRLFVDMRLVEGRDLQTILAEGPLEPGRAVRIIEQIAEALHAAHKIGLVHRDVKPSNILLDESDFAYLIDFGIARAAGETGLTGTSGVIGSWHYMAPERFGAKEVDQRSDVYSLACVLWECLTGLRPYPGDSLEQQYAGHVAAPPPRPSSTGAPAEFDPVVAKGMAKQPDQRYATTVELARAARDAVTVPIPRPAPVVSPQSGTAAAPTMPAQYPIPPPGGGYASAPAWQRPPDQVWTPQREPPVRPPPAPVRARRWWRRRAVLILVAAAVTVVAIVAAVILASTGSRPGGQTASPATSEPSQTTAPHPTTTPRQTTPRQTTRQETLAFTGLKSPQGVAVDGKGTVYVTDLNNRVVALPAGSTAQTVLPFTGLGDPWNVAVDGKGTVYVADSGNNRVVALPAGSTAQTVLAFTGLQAPLGVAVDSKGTVYVTDRMNDRVLALSAGSTAQSVLPFTGLNVPDAVAVDSEGTVYITDNQDRVLALSAGSTAQTVLPFTGLFQPNVAVDSKGTVYVADGVNNRVLALAAGSTTPTLLPFTGLSHPSAVAVDSTGTVYVVDSINNRVVTLRAD